MKLKLGDFFGKIFHRDNRNLGFRTASTADNRALAKSFKSTQAGAKVMTSKPMPAVLRAGAAGRFELGQFRQVHQASLPGPPFAGVGPARPSVSGAGPQAAGAQVAPLPLAGGLNGAAAPVGPGSGPAAAAQPRVSMGSAPQPNLAQERLQQSRQGCTQALNQAQQALSDWGPATAAARSPREQALARQPVAAALARASGAVEQLLANGGSAQEVANGRQLVARLAVQVALGLPHASLQPRVQGQGQGQALMLEPYVQGATQALVELAHTLRHPAMDAQQQAALLPDLARRLASGQAGDDAASLVPERIRDALVRVEVNAQAITKACSPPSDASGLMMMMRRDADLQPVAMAARRQGLERTLVGAAASQARLRNLPAPQQQALRQELAATAGRLVQHEATMVEARQRLVNALRLEGRPLGVNLQDKRMDAALIKGLREHLGGDATRLGLVLAASFSLEAAALEGADMSAYRNAVQTQLTAARAAMNHTRAQRDAEVQQGAAGPGVQAFRKAQEAVLTLERVAQAIRLPDHAQGEGLDAVAATGGLSAVELAKLGLTQAETHEVLERARQLAQKGLWGADQAGAAIQTVNEVAQALQKGLNEAPRAGQSNERLAGNLGAALLAQATGLDTVAARPDDATIAQRVQQWLPDLAAIEDPLRPSLQAFNRASESNLSVAANRGSVPVPGPQALDAKALDYDALSVRLQAQVHEMERLGQQAEASQAALERFNQGLPAGIKRLNPQQPQGLAISLALKRVDDLLAQEARILDSNRRDWGQNLMARNQRLGEITRELASLLGSLKRFDPKTMALSAKSGAGVRDLASLRAVFADPAQRKTLMETADAIIFQRRDGSQALSVSQSRSRELVLQMDRLMRERAAIMNTASSTAAAPGPGPGPGAQPAVHEQVRNLIRAAVLEVWSTSGKPLEQFRPSEHAGAVQERLATWGLDTARLRPEINHQLSESFGAMELSLWARQSAVGEDALLKQRPAAAAAQPGPAVDPEAAQRMVDGLKPGSVMKFYGGTRWEVEASVIVAPTADVAVGGKYERMKMSNLELERSKDGFVLTVRKGTEQVAGLDVTVTLGRLFGGKLRGKAALEGTYGRVDGLRMVFNPNKPESVARLKAMMGRIVQGQALQPQDLLDADDIAPSFESKALAKGTAQVSNKPKGANFSAGRVGEEGAVGLDAGGFVQLRAGVSLEGGREWGSEDNTNQESYADAWEVTAQAFGGLALRTEGVLGTGEKGAVEADSAMGQTVDAVMATKVKIKRSGDFDAQGRLESAGMTRDLRAGSHGWTGALGRLVGGEAFRAVLDAPGNGEVKAQYEQAVKMIQGNDILRVKYRMTEAAQQAITDLSQRARQLEERALQADPDAKASGRSLMKEAAVLRADIQKMINDNGSYVPDKLMIVPMQQNVQSLTAALPFVPFFRAGTFREEQTLYTAFEMKLPG